MGNATEELTFWEHLDVLRGSIIRMLVASVLVSVFAFVLKEQLFAFVLAPTDSSFVTYRLLGIDEPFDIKLVNTQLTEQFMVHMKVALIAGVLVASPYIIYLLYGFVAPALYEKERRCSVRLVASSYVMFLVGIAVNYLLVFPLTVRFLGTYQVSDDVSNMLTLSSYIDTFTMMSLVFGVVFEMPVVAWLLARFGMIRPEWMTRYRRHAIVAILIAAAILTPTADVLTLIIVALPIWLLYEASIGIAKLTEKN